MWVFDHSSCHAAMADGALEVGKLNVKPGGKRKIMHDTMWNGRMMEEKLKRDEDGHERARHFNSRKNG